MPKKDYRKVYFQEMGLYPEEYNPCEVCKAPGVDVHHIEARGMGGTKKEDTIDNLMLVCRSCHEKYGDKKHFKDYLKTIHEEVMIRNGITVS
jgi:uncharacterized protein with PIN domain